MVISMSDFSLANDSFVQRFFYPMTNVIQNYAWGSPSSFSQLFGIDNQSGEPQAEIWMGAHPNGCSMVTDNGQQTTLSNLISKNLNLFLSEKVASRFGELPYLFKVLAAEKALSVQVHPNTEIKWMENTGSLQTSSLKNKTILEILALF